MIIFLIVLLVVSLIGIRVRNDDSFLENDDTLAINGIFIMLVFLSHCEQYLTLSNGILNSLYQKFRDVHGQLIVTTFLTFSGYGIMRQAIIKSSSYFNSFPKKRILKVLLNFDIAIFIYLLLAVLMEQSFGIKHIILSFVGYTSIGNSNWYIFAILVMYIVTYLSALIFKNCYNKIAISITLGAIIYICVLDIVLKQEQWYFSTILCYPFGVWIAIYRDKIKDYINKRWISTMAICLVCFGVTYKYRHNAYVMNFHSIAFVFSLIMVLTKIKIGNICLKYLGNHLFSIFILQRIPMIVFNYYNIIGEDRYVSYVLASFGCTLVLAYVFDRYITKFVNRIVC